MKNKIGTYLRQHREEKKLTLEQVAEHTGIREPYLEDLENGDFHKIPGDVFIRGFCGITGTIWAWMAMAWWRLTAPAANRKRS